MPLSCWGPRRMSSAFKSLRPSSTPATRSASFSRHRRRSPRSPVAVPKISCSRFTHEILTAATRSGRFSCHWQRARRSPESPLRFDSALYEITGYPGGVSRYLVPLTGIEPVRILLRGILSPLCLPIPPCRRGNYGNIFSLCRQGDWTFLSSFNRISHF